MPADLPALKALDALCFPPLVSYSRAELYYLIRRPHSDIVIAEAAGELAGFCVTHWKLDAGRKIGHIITIDVVPELRRAGIGRTLMEWSERQLQAEGCIAITLEVARGNLGAQHFYACLGYAVTARIPGYYADGTEALIMRRELATPTAS